MADPFTGFEGGSVGLADLLTAIQSLNQNLSQVIQTLQTVLPNIQANATTATSGVRTLPGNPAGFLVVTNPVTGNSIRVPYYNP